MLDYLLKKYGKAVISIEEAASELGVTPKEVQELINSGALSILPLKNEPVITLQAFVAFLTGENKVKTVTTSCCETVNDELLSTSAEIIYEEEYEMVKGYISHLADGRYVMQIDFGKIDGKRVRESKSFKSEEEAKEALSARLEEIKKDNKKPADNKMTGRLSGRTPLRDFMDAYLKLDMTCTSTTKECYYYAAGKLAEEIGSIPIEEITEELVGKVFSKLRQRYQQSTLDKIRITLKMVMKYAHKKGYISQNPVEDLKPVKSQLIKKEREPYTKEEIRYMLDEAKDNMELYPILCMFAGTSCRPEEVRALKWSNLDWEKKTIKIDSAIVSERINQGIGKRGKSVEKEGPTKSSSGVRSFPISDEAIAALKKWREYINTNEEYQYARESKYIFCGKNGDFLTDTALRLRFNRFVKRIGKANQGYFLYRFRHTYCTNLCRNGTPLDKVQRLMGDATLDVIMDVYNHVKDEDTYKYAEKYLNDLMV
jgi:integrase